MCYVTSSVYDVFEQYERLHVGSGFEPFACEVWGVYPSIIALPHYHVKVNDCRRMWHTPLRALGGPNHMATGMCAEDE